MMGRVLSGREPSKLKLNATGLSIVLDGRSAVTDADVKASLDEAWGRDVKGVFRAAKTLAELTTSELDLLEAFACLENSDSAEARSWRDRLVRSIVALSKIDSTLFPAAVLTARRSVASREALWAKEGRVQNQPPLSPFTAVSDGSESE